MEKIASFNVHHENLKRGVYVSRVDNVGSEVVTTFDIRMKEPNKFSMKPGAIHTIEHLGATYLRNDEDIKDKVLYFGPMGCQTGFYLIVKGEWVPNQIITYLTSMYCFMESAMEIPGLSPDECGNFLLHDLEGARVESEVFLHEVLLRDDIPTEYPDE